MHERTRKEFTEYFHQRANKALAPTDGTGDDSFDRLIRMINAAGRAAEKAVLDAWIAAEKEDQ